MYNPDNYQLVETFVTARKWLSVFLQVMGCFFFFWCYKLIYNPIQNRDRIPALLAEFHIAYALSILLL